MRRRTLLAVTGAAALLAGCSGRPDRRPPRPQQSDIDWLQDLYRFEQVGSPPRTIMRNSAGKKLAELTHGSHTVLFTGAARTFSESAATRAKVTGTGWARLAPQRFDPTLLADDLFADWLEAQLTSTAEDILSVACQYITGAPSLLDASSGTRIAGDAAFGYLNNESTRDGADFYDFLGIPWTWPDGTISRPAPKWAGALDCSGYIRLVFGYRLGMALHRTNAAVTEGLPRTAYAMAMRTPCTVIAEDAEPDRPPKDLSRVAPGDVAFFALHDRDPSLITHSGIVLGADDHDGIRFVSSRQTINGPTFGDAGGDGVLGAGFFGERLRRIIRL